MKRVLSAILVLLMLAGVVCFGSISAAAMGEPTDLYWSGSVANWSAPSEPISYYSVELYQNGNFLTSATVYDTYADFGSYISNCGPGDYTFTVCGAFSEGPAWISDPVTSPVYHYEEGCTHDLKSVTFHYPTCTEDGEKGHYECTKCGKWFWDDQAKNEITDHDETKTEKLGHLWGEWTVTKAATKNEEGEEQRVCQHDSEHVETRAIPKLSSSDPAPATSAPTAKATEAATSATSATDATSATEAGRRPVEVNGNSLFGIFGGGFWVLLLIILLSLIVLAVIIVVIVLLVKRKKDKDDQPPQGPRGPQGPYGPQNPQAPPTGPAQTRKPGNDYNDPYNGV